MNKKIFLKPLLISILILILCILLYSIYLLYKELTLNTNKSIISNTENTITNTEKKLDTKEILTTKNLELIDNEYKGFLIDSKLEIPSINLVTNILSNYSQNAIDTSPTKFFGPPPNTYGNYCIAGHNYINPNMFKNLININIGDKLFLTDNINGKYKYIVYEKYKVKSNDTNPLIQESTNSRILTLITCVNYSDSRLIIKAHEI